MKVEVGNATAIEGYREEEDGPVLYRNLEGERITTIMPPDDLSMIEAVQTVAATLAAHMQPGTKPVWIEADSMALQAYLCEHFQIPTTSARPMSWGANTSEPEKLTKPRKAAAKKSAPAPVPAPTTEES